MSRRKHKRSAKADRPTKTFRITPENQAILADIAQRTGWTEAKAVNTFVQATDQAINGSKDAMASLSTAIRNAIHLRQAEEDQERKLAPLREAARKARLALRPLVMKIRQTKSAPTGKAIARMKKTFDTPN